jgi:serine protease Do
MTEGEKMNKRNIYFALSLGALAVALAALPGKSTKPQTPDGHANTVPKPQPRVVEFRAQQVSQTPEAQEAGTEIVQEIERMQGPDGDDMEVFIGGGSWLGVETNEVTADQVKELKLSAERGVLVGKIIPDSPASKAGLKENDVITELNSQRVEGTAQFRRMIREIPSGRKAQLTVMRDGHPQTVSVTLAKQESRGPSGMMRAPTPGAFAFRVPEAVEMPEIAELGELNSFGIAGMGHARFGIDAEDLRGDLGKYFGAPDGEGVLVRSVLGDSPAAKAGIKAGDVIVSVNGKRIRQVHELREAVRDSSEEKPLKVGLLRNKSDLTLDVQVSARVKKEVHQRSERSTL